MKCNKIKIRSVYLSVIKSNIIKYKQTCQWINVDKLYCIPRERESERERALYLCSAERSQIKKGRLKTRGGRRKWFFLHFWDSFGSIFLEKAQIIHKRRYLRYRAKLQSNSKILFTAGMLDGVWSNVHKVKQHY